MSTQGYISPNIPCSPNHKPSSIQHNYTKNTILDCNPVKESNKSLIAPADHHLLRSHTNRRDKVNKKKSIKMPKRPTASLQSLCENIPGPTWAIQSRAIGRVLHSIISLVSSIGVNKFASLYYSIDESTVREILPLDFLLGSQTERTSAPPVGSADR